MRYRNKLGRFSRKPKSETLSKNLFGSPGSSTSSVKMEGPHEIEQENQNNVLNLLPPPPPPARTLQTYLHPARNTIPSCILLPPNMPNIDFRPGMVQILPEFHGLENENPYVHVISQPQVAAVGNFQRPYNSYPEAYNQAPRNQPNFRWRNEPNPQPYGDGECEFVYFIGTLMHEQFVKSARSE
ncbi:hypothetical protein M0R45_030502 [Rubus argutus]|uniref:Uncharacterized protein n=1 Tax=Rubus argutus TaxID=59490 RepID=A0AAW1WFC0_RUBAR